jgi:tRNA A-37 threonylcarbamoyl transferase component Bud32
MDRDLSRSRAVLISNATYRDDGIPDLPAASGCTSAMTTLLTGDLCGWPSDRVESLPDLAAPHELARKIVNAIKGVQDVLLLYYVGHGIRTATGQLALALAETSADPELVPHTAILYEAIARILRGCAAATKIVILDCCHAELGNKANFQFQSADIDGEPVDGLYFIGASKQWEKAKSPVSGGLTYFTDAFINVVRTGIPGKPSQLTIDQIFTELRSRMVRSNLPEPVQSGIKDAHHWPFAWNSAPPDTHHDAGLQLKLLLQRLEETEGLKAVAEAKITALQVELSRLRRRASRPMTAQEQSQLETAIDITERILEDTVADAAAWTESPAALSAVPGKPSQPVEGQHHDHSAAGKARPRLLGDRYEIEGVVGRGGMAEVYRARDIRLDRVVAIKTLRADLARDQTFQARFRREARSVSSLNNPSIVAVHDTGEDMSTGVPVPYIVMEYVDGRTVWDLLIESHRLLPERSLEIISGVLRALEYSHQAGVVHRDIKPANVMISRNGEVKVMDFGIARAKGDDTMTQTAQVIGTAQYLSPEQARGERVDSRSDLYSTGCLMYELLTGRPPFTGDSPVAIAYQHVRENPIPPSRLDPDIPPWADAITLKAMAKPPDERYQTAAEMRADVQRAASGEEVTATPPPWTRAESHGHTNRTRRMGPQTMTGTAPTAATPPSPLPSYDDYHEFWQPRGTKAQRWPGWFGRKSNET